MSSCKDYADEVGFLRKENASLKQRLKVAEARKTMADNWAKRAEELGLQVRELRNLLLEIGNEDVGKPITRDEALKILRLLNKTGYAVKG